jgi:hypothetical protein
MLSGFPRSHLCARWSDARQDNFRASLIKPWTSEEVRHFVMRKLVSIASANTPSSEFPDTSPYGNRSFTRPVSSTISKDEPFFSRSGRMAKQRPSGLSLLDGKRIASILLTA